MSHLKTIIRQLYEVANKSMVDQQLAAALLKSNKLITKPCCNIPNNFGSIHAEANAISTFFDKYIGKINTKKKYNLIVIRKNQCGGTCNARPCYKCLDMMKIYGIKKVYYSIGNDENIICENVKDMISIHSSSVTKFFDKCNDVPLHEYYEHLLKVKFPSEVKLYNLELFINYNLLNVLPNYKVKIVKNKYITIINNKNLIIVEAILV
jgi:tRNA(Arg) A34 adenosine deaminase TadA